MTPQASPKSNLIRGALWAVFTRWLTKALGFINTVIMARLLMPEDYGIVAMSMLMVGFIQASFDLDATVALLRKQKITREEIDSAWTLRLVQGILAGIVIFLSAPVAVRYFGEPRVLEVLWVFAACVVLTSFNNVAQTLALRDFDFTIDFKISTIGKLGSVVATIAFGFLLLDYRALTLGIVTGYIVSFILGYTLHPYRPRWDTSKIPEIWHLTKWVLISNIGGFLLRKSDELAAGRIGATSEFGIYNVGSDLGQLPVSEIGPAMQRAILPVLASIKNDRERTRLAILKILSSVATVIWPIALGFSALALDTTKLVLGEKWLAAAPFVAVFSITSALLSSGGPLRSYLTLLGHTRVQNTVTWLEFFCFLAAAVLIVPAHGLLGLAYARGIGSLFSIAGLLSACHKYCGLHWKSSLKYC
ncbi:MAG: lipopolysaccharide biosynthesis protein, partial [Candidatus Accumulibacter sp.]|nr:lipopolysaccharide biosynthesis protein [Accumulibacter sp.]